MKPLLLVFGLNMFIATNVFSKIELANNGYEGISIIIKETVAEDSEILSKIQTIFTKASAKLFKATKNMVYFRNISIVIPKSWTPKSEYTSISKFSSTGSFVLVDNPRGGVDNTPYVQEGSGCGSEGQYMHLTPNFLLSDADEYGPQENVIVHEWGHLRWGLMDETASVPRQNKVWSFYIHGGKWVPVRCTDDVKGDIRQDCNDATTECSTETTFILDNQGCQFCVHDNGDVKASLMGFQYIQSLDGFCDDPEDQNVSSEYKHNKEAYNRQNTECDRKSAWEVMRQHSDFNGTRTQLPDGTDTQPVFQLVQQQDKVRVLILDVSGSMSGERLERMRKASETIIRTLLQKDSWLAIVSFETNAYALADFRRITSEVDRDHFVNVLPTDTLDLTSIGAGLALALQMIKSSGLACRESEFILVTDGQENTQPYIADVIDEIVECGLVVKTIGITQSADDKIKELAEATNGKRFTYLETPELTFLDILKEVISTSAVLADSHDPVEILSTTETVLNSSSSTGTFVIDSGLGNDTKLTADFSGITDVVLTCTDPNGFSQQLNVHDSNLAIFSLPGTLEAGQYNYMIQSTYNVDANVYVTSAPNSVDSQVVRVNSYLNQNTLQFDGSTSLKLFADVMKGTLPVINAEVLAVIQTPTGQEIQLKLEDNGLEPDFRQNDGKYAGFILAKYLDSNGEYTTKILVRDTEETKTFLPARGSNAQAPADTDQIQIEEDVGSFERVSVAEGLTVSNYFLETKDVIPPARITDLQVTDIYTVTEGTTEQREFTIYWTAVGDDMNIGIASEYDMRISETFADLDKKLEIAPAAPFTFTSPNQAGFIEHLFVSVSSDATYDSTLFVALRAIDSSGNKGAMSNIIAVTVPFNYRTTAKLTFRQSSSLSDDSSDAADAHKFSIAILATVVTLSIVAVLALVVVVVCIWKTKQKPKKKVDPLAKLKDVSTNDTNARTRFSVKHASPQDVETGPYIHTNRSFVISPAYPLKVQHSHFIRPHVGNFGTKMGEENETTAHVFDACGFNKIFSASPSRSFIEVLPCNDNR